MTRIVEHRSALPNGPVVCVHVRRDPDSDHAVFASVALEVFGQSPDPDAFPQRLPVEEAFLHALSYAERAGVAVVWIDDPHSLFPPTKRPVREVGGK